MESEEQVEDYFNANKDPFKNNNKEETPQDDSFLVSGFIAKKNKSNNPLFPDDEDD